MAGLSNLDDMSKQLSSRPSDAQTEAFKPLEPNAEKQMLSPQDPGNPSERNSVSQQYQLNIKQSENTREPATVYVNGQNVEMRVQHTQGGSTGLDANNKSYDIKPKPDGSGYAGTPSNSSSDQGSIQKAADKSIVQAAVNPTAAKVEVPAAAAAAKVEVPAAVAAAKVEVPAAVAAAKVEVPAAVAAAKVEVPAAVAAAKVEVPAAVAAAKVEVPAAVAAAVPKAADNTSPTTGNPGAPSAAPVLDGRSGTPSPGSTRAPEAPSNQQPQQPGGRWGQGDNTGKTTAPATPTDNRTGATPAPARQDTTQPSRWGNDSQGQRPNQPQSDRQSSTPNQPQGDRQSSRTNQQQSDQQSSKANQQQSDQQSSKATQQQSDQQSTKATQQQGDQQSTKATQQQGDQQSTKATQQQGDQQSTKATQQQGDQQSTKATQQQQNDQAANSKANQEASDQANSSKTNPLDPRNAGEALLKTGNAALDQEIAARMKALNPEELQQLAKLMEQTKGLDQVAAGALAKIEGLLALGSLEKGIGEMLPQEKVQGELRPVDLMREAEATGQILEAGKTAALNAATAGVGQAESLLRTVSDTKTSDQGSKVGPADASLDPAGQNAGILGQGKGQGANQANALPGSKPDSLIASGPNAPFATRPDATIISGGTDKGSQGTAPGEHGLFGDGQPGHLPGSEAGKGKHKDDQGLDGLPFGIPAVPFGLADMLTGKGDKKEEKEEEEAEKDKKNDPDRRQKYLVQQGDTLESIAASKLGDKLLAPLIYEINSNVITSWMKDGKRVVELRPELAIWLPTATDIQDFRSTQSASQDADKSEAFEYAGQAVAPDQELAAWEANLKTPSTSTTNQLQTATVAFDAAQTRRNNVEKLLGPLSSKPADDKGRIKYTVRLGDTLRTIAMKHPALQDVQLWTLLAEINEAQIQDDAKTNPKLKRGTSVLIPSVEEIAAFKDRQRQKDVPKTKLELVTKPCPECERLTTQDATMCPKCGHSFVETALKPELIVHAEENFGAENFSPEPSPNSEVLTERRVTETFVHEEVSERYEEIIQKQAEETELESASDEEEEKSQEDPTTTILIAAGLLPAQTKIDVDQTPVVEEAGIESQASEVPTELNGSARQLSATCRLAENQGDNNQAQALSLEVEQGGKWQAIVTYEIYSDISFRHEYARDGKRRTIRVDLPPHAVKELAETDLNANWEKYSESFHAGKRISQ